MASDNRNNPPKPQTNKDQKVTDLPQKKGNTSKDEKVKGGYAKPNQPPNGLL